jgi:hypothetical protein
MKSLIAVFLICTATTVAAPFTFRGVEYDTTLLNTVVEQLHLPAWQVGEAEPPILPNQAYRAAKAACAAQFGKATEFYLLSVDLRHQPAVGETGKAFTFYEVIFSEKLTEAEFARRRTPGGSPGVTKAYAANMSYLVLMDGTVISPAPVAKNG